eukprot:CAMPEP_0201867556 /NCGR_PEP_ID=MMETSP0902-20130614/1743_1 /ASSEMBLY_ACC=CAM_ASM_000551 /TAXON_ID=420261 /ORGANISM="Thalassiosira antarctica, Strain CCMP982" /LENGTH=79 /DNA_ID=CAMNT_0048392731 /DNA_START=138 /DNA_END=377 /DNA_ORIENTATION=+
MIQIRPSLRNGLPKSTSCPPKEKEECASCCSSACPAKSMANPLATIKQSTPLPPPTNFYRICDEWNRGSTIPLGTVVEE